MDNPYRNVKDNTRHWLDLRCTIHRVAGKAVLQEWNFTRTTHRRIMQGIERTVWVPVWETIFNFNMKREWWGRELARPRARRPR